MARDMDGLGKEFWGPAVEVFYGTRRQSGDPAKVFVIK
jgi:hypothetical protein